ncbi:MAG: Cell division ATP-binding protein FtsE [Candidatus Moranbacteria bacterium GW2011_GWE2_35_2-]|nr:MAG: Cell division ATP-binding protein FtsE [Candidatus Moranbacteria bacterium GW2011_GWE2_35_2-]KKQ22956.1 MAG: Cell division ATP-binding protein FtsE [Candidatus Moranbacteria bacterium GW2011_GWF2_37_11]KKQ29314.1 MAG: Cell division ATP-binding protein FtsE [Candidatus Moranbacteria bacterium GW2011_GWD1_37_17]KKQ30813.1 MAG: Cell division ATP-binding protein FtsE [Candidatus Moranbacteria bacterium GW2011_GWE1_37_24]KKQ47984.1 MAG: Cell division ATP-binding protein FtsE [Candidatus Mora
MIRYENVGKIFSGDFVALEDVNLQIEKGEFVSVIGHSGAGKSTLLKLLYAEEQPTSGQVLFDGRDLATIKKRHLPYYRRNIGTVFQDFKLLSEKTVFRNVSYALEVIGKTSQEINEEVPEILDIVGLADKMEKYPNQLSGGERQKVSLARALIHRPAVIVADEPTGNLDPNSSWDIIKLLVKINDLGTTVILATHDREVVDKLNKRVVVLEKGKIVSDCKKGKYVC